MVGAILEVVTKAWVINAIIEIAALSGVILVGSLIAYWGTEVISRGRVRSEIAGAMIIGLSWLIIIGGIFYILAIRHI